MKHLLMIVPFFPPLSGGGVFRPLGHIRHLSKYGWRTTVLAPKGGTYWILDEQLLEGVPSSCEVFRSETLSGQSVMAFLRGGRKGGGKRDVRSSRGFALLRKLGASLLFPDTYIGWYPFAVRLGRRILDERSVDAIYSTSPPETSHLIGRKLHEISGLPWVADFRDPWMNLDLLPPPTRFHRRMHERLEAGVCSRAGVVVTNRWHEELMRKRYPNLQRIRRIPNGYERADMESLGTLSPPKDRFRIVHAGMLTQRRNAAAFLKGLKLFLDQNPKTRGLLEVLFVGPREGENDAAARSLGLTDVVEFRGTASHEETLQLERTSHILLLVKHLNPLYRGIVPGKLYEYMGVRRPILALVPDGEAKDTILRFRLGEIASLDDARGIADKTAEMYGAYQRGVLDRAYDLTFRPEFERETLAGELADFLDSLVRDSGE